mmetsp:Transcript_28511/g.56035  ORF Transcript_28511/g.56035 Transcript_28511/m.56035 type:complete len:954 (-) Transcript_28511:213-3074(-)|eukprot:CAMPEP_0175120832 /NCGR_PEP_ID=MMETSP0087-20121206/836_1 /TAXON_ID=136419 /ORGANISM="Unknown Unknown, Strain D1" /LENGTH=953 /DNA_ID=CAMNT_0016402315 /DNA_START=35 /DNA_END=2896 /DNA_ORIENTATION=-
MGKSEAPTPEWQKDLEERHRTLRKNHRAQGLIEEASKREDRNGGDKNFNYPPSGSYDWDVFLSNGAKHTVDGMVCSTCVPPPIRDYAEHNIGTRVAWMGSSPPGATGTVTWLSRDRTHIKLRMDDKKHQKLIKGKMWSGAKFQPLGSRWAKRIHKIYGKFHRSSAAQTPAWVTAEAKIRSDYVKGLSKVELRFLEEAGKLEDRNQGDKNFKLPTPESLSFLQLKAHYQHIVEGETCFTCVPPPRWENYNLSVGLRVSWLGSATSALGTVRWISLCKTHVKVEMDDPSLTKWNPKKVSPEVLAKNRDPKNKKKVGYPPFEARFVWMMSSAKFAPINQIPLDNTINLEMILADYAAWKAYHKGNHCVYVQRSAEVATDPISHSIHPYAKRYVGAHLDAKRAAAAAAARSRSASSHARHSSQVEQQVKQARLEMAQTMADLDSEVRNVKRLDTHRPDPPYRSSAGAAEAAGGAVTVSSDFYNEGPFKSGYDRHVESMISQEQATQVSKHLQDSLPRNLHSRWDNYHQDASGLGVEGYYRAFPEGVVSPRGMGGGVTMIAGGNTGASGGNSMVVSNGSGSMFGQGGGAVLEMSEPYNPSTAYHPPPLPSPSQANVGWEKQGGKLVSAREGFAGPSSARTRSAWGESASIDTERGGGGLTGNKYLDSTMKRNPRAFGLQADMGNNVANDFRGVDRTVHCHGVVGTGTKGILKQSSSNSSMVKDHFWDKYPSPSSAQISSKPLPQFSEPETLHDTGKGYYRSSRHPVFSRDRMAGETGGGYYNVNVSDYSTTNTHHHHHYPSASTAGVDQPLNIGPGNSVNFGNTFGSSNTDAAVSMPSSDTALPGPGNQRSEHTSAFSNSRGPSFLGQDQLLNLSAVAKPASMDYGPAAPRAVHGLDNYDRPIFTHGEKFLELQNVASPRSGTGSTSRAKTVNRSFNKDSTNNAHARQITLNIGGPVF